MQNIGIIGLGFVGYAMYQSFEKKGLTVGENLFGYDKFNSKGNCNFDEITLCDILFLALPTKYSNSKKQYDKSILYNVCDDLRKNNFDGVIVIKSTVEPGTTYDLEKQFENLNFIHNPEFLTAITAYEDFHDQKHIVLGKGKNCSEEKLEKVSNFYKKYYIDNISVCSALESESMKIYVNCFYSVKVQFFTELFLTCSKNGCDYNKVKDMMLKNGWINKMHTIVPGPDGKISYGGLCFPKDTNALNEYMKDNDIPNGVLNACIQERNSMRDDHDNVDD